MDDQVIDAIGQKALLALLYEVSASPKPGLVDRFNSGAHDDMDFFTFMAGSASLAGYFFDCAAEGTRYAGKEPEELFRSLRPIGIEAEHAMFEATGGVNTQKGLVFSLGIICAAASCCLAEGGNGNADTDAICAKAARMTRGLCSRELERMDKTGRLTHGEKLYQEYGLKGIRGEVESGFSTVRRISLPALAKLKTRKSYELNDIIVQTLLHLMAENEDTNIVARHDPATLEYVRRYARRVLAAGGMLTSAGASMAREMDREFIERHISPGGSADLLAVTLMLDSLNSVAVPEFP